MEISGVIIVRKIFSQVLLTISCSKMIPRYLIIKLIQYYDYLIFTIHYRVQLSYRVPVSTLHCHITMVLLSSLKDPLNRPAR